MRTLITMRQALADPAYFAGQLGGESWSNWRVLLLAIMGERLTEEERIAFQMLTGRPTEPAEPVREFTGVIGRRGGKSRALGVLCAFLACCVDHRSILAPGERAVLPVMASTKDQAASIFNFVVGSIEAAHALAPLIKDRTADSLTLINEVTITVRPASFRSIRGINAVAAVGDETAFWNVDEAGANPDLEIIRALKPALMNSKGPLIVISSPYSRRGYLWTTYRKHFGKAASNVLVAQASTTTMNPLADKDWISAFVEDDPVAAEAEINAQFRSDVAAFIDREVIERCVVAGRRELPPVQGVRYHGFVDPSGGSSDSMTLAVAHAEKDKRIVLDVVREIRPPFSPDGVVAEFAALLKSYRLASVTGDYYGGEWPGERFRAHGITYHIADKTRSDLYLALLPLMNAGRVDLLDEKRLVTQLAGLERRTARSGKDSVNHPPGGHDDVANAVAGALVLTSAARSAMVITPELLAMAAMPAYGARAPLHLGTFGSRY